ncbi:hypothetical protein C0J52_04586 [Blattella germanica]|nr:hypothetical protein C0J52_04586 [Blattella germanica]
MDSSLQNAHTRSSPFYAILVSRFGSYGYARMNYARNSGDWFDDENQKNSLPPDSPRKPVKSTAVVKYSAAQSIANFAQLQCNTNLNLPPSNWLSSSAESYGLQSVPCHSSGFSSFRMAHMFPDCVGEVDVVSDAENIKKLLKIPYSKGPVSMMVHRIENTLLIDEFDIHKHLLRTAESEWEWLKKFFFEHVIKSLSDKEKRLFHKNNSRNALQQKSLVSKYPNVNWDRYAYIWRHNTSLHQSKIELVMCYHLDGIVQRYELIKTEDLPHLENSKFSPKLIRDVAQNILSFLKSNATKAGHTYWLFKGKDDDVVKLYDLTSLCTDVMDDKEQNPFTVPVAMLLYRVARNMKHSTEGRRQQGTIRMLLKNCLTLLAKEKYPQIVTSAHYMLSDLYVPADTDPAAPSLDSNVNDDDDDEEEKHVEEEEAEGSLSSSSSVAVKALCVSNQEAGMQHESKFNSPPPVCGGVEERCKMALEHVSSGLECLQYFDKQMKNEKQQEVPKMAHPFQAIPMPYSPLSNQEAPNTFTNKKTTSKKKKKKPKEESNSPKALLCKSRTETMPTWQQPDKADNLSWNVHLKTLLYEKACLVYVTLSERRALHYIAHVLHVLSALHTCSGLHSYLLGRAGDCCFMMVQDWGRIDEHRENYALCTEVDQEVITQIEKDTDKADEVPETLDSIEQVLTASCGLYEKALALEPQSNLQRRLGNIHNELGVLKAGIVPFCPDEVISLIPDEEDDSRSEETSWAASFEQKLKQARCDKTSATSLRAKRLSLTPGKGIVARDFDKNEIGNENSISSDRNEEELDTREDEEMKLKGNKKAGDELNVNDFAVVKFPTKKRIRFFIGRINSVEDDTYDMTFLRKKIAVDIIYFVYPDNEDAVEVEKTQIIRKVVPVHGRRDKFEEKKEENVLQSLFSHSLEHLEAGVKAFETVRDEANLALLHSNTGRLMRMSAHFHSPDAGSRQELAGQERHFYNKALASYQKAIQVLGNRRSNPAIWDTVIWELSTTLYTMATLLQDYPTQRPRQPIYQFRAASIHHRLASLYHKSCRTLSSDEARRRNVLFLARLHYEKASRLLFQLEHPLEFLRVQMERVALAEFQVQNATSAISKVKALQSVLELIQQSHPMLQIMLEKESPGSEHEEEEEECKLLQLLEQRLQVTLRNLTKLCLNKQELGNTYKLLYSLTLQKKESDSTKAILTSLINVLSNMDSALRPLELKAELLPTAPQR